MSLETKPGSQWWYGRYYRDGKRTAPINLNVKVQGHPPGPGNEFGDALYERSKAAAQAKLNVIIAEVKEPGNEARLLQRMHQLKTGRKLETIPIRDMVAPYLQVERGQPLNPRWVQQIAAIVDQFASFCATWTPAVFDMSRVTTQLAEEWAMAERAKGYAPATYNNHLGAMSAIFGALGPRVGLAANPFGGIHKLSKIGQTIHKRPFNESEIANIIAAVEEDDFIRPIIKTALSTAMRRCDCCLLRYEDLDWPEHTIRVTPAKRGARVGIPIFPMLRDELASRMDIPHAPRDFVFPEQAKKFLENPSAITSRVQDALRRAGFTYRSDDESKAMTVERRSGHRRANVRGTHSFRTTWITLALLHGMSVEAVQAVTGQKSVQVVLENYFNPSDAQRRKLLLNHLPSVLTTGKLSPSATSAKAKAEMVLRSLGDDAAVIAELMRILKQGA